MLPKSTLLVAKEKKPNFLNDFFITSFLFFHPACAWIDFSVRFGSALRFLGWSCLIAAKH
ncbi:hypothetical protein EPC75_06855 [Helicobacter pylori]|nr:hypothetical protein EPC73_01840 [Helicobacter pylori]KAA6503240.1 hypothetical protein EPC78_06610 [Helicobacter pylori]KAA6517086.1 hypothetical protein EPC75_06855 [Helicobacter pylori]